VSFLALSRLTLKNQGGWRHDGRVQGYIEEASRFEENAAGSLLHARIKPA
jgi:hypothetical protein